MASARDIASLMTAGMTGPTGGQDVSAHSGIVRSWDPTSGVNSVEINGVVLTNLTALQNGMGVSYLPGDVVEVIRVQTRYFILGRLSAPGGSTGGSPVGTTTGAVVNLLGSAEGVWLNLPSTPTVTIRVGHAVRVAFGASNVYTGNSGVVLGLKMTGPAVSVPDDIPGTATFSSTQSADAGVIVAGPASKEVFFYNHTSWTSGGVTQQFTPGVYTYTLMFKLFRYAATAWDKATVDAPWISVIPF